MGDPSQERKCNQNSTKKKPPKTLRNLKYKQSKPTRTQYLLQHRASRSMYSQVSPECCFDWQVHDFRGVGRNKGERLQRRPKGPQGCPKDLPRATQGRPKDAQRSPQGAPGSPKNDPGVPQDDQGQPKDIPGAPPKSPKTFKDLPRMPTGSPRSPNDLQRAPHGVPKAGPGASEEPQGVRIA